MLNIILNIIGIFLIIYSIFIIKKDVSFNKEDNSTELNEKKLRLDETMENSNQNKFDEMIYRKIKKADFEEKKSDKKTTNTELSNLKNLIIKEEKKLKDNYKNPLHKKIIELNNIGLNNEEIARRLGKGVREIDIIIKLYRT